MICNSRLVSFIDIDDLIRKGIIEFGSSEKRTKLIKPQLDTFLIGPDSVQNQLDCFIFPNWII